MFLLLFCKLYPLEFCTTFYHPESTSKADLEFQRQDVYGICFSQAFQKALMPIGLYISFRRKSIILSCSQMKRTDIHHKSCNSTRNLPCFHPYMKASFPLLLFLFLLDYESSNNLPNALGR